MSTVNKCHSSQLVKDSHIQDLVHRAFWFYLQRNPADLHKKINIYIGDHMFADELMFMMLQAICFKTLWKICTYKKKKIL